MHPDTERRSDEWDVRFEPGTDSLVAVICQAVADVRSVQSAEDLTPLERVVDTEALERIFEPTASGRTRAPGVVEFVYEEIPLSVYSDGRIRLSYPGANDARTRSATGVTGSDGEQ
jgi:hypothetical protein